MAAVVNDEEGRHATTSHCAHMHHFFDPLQAGQQPHWRLGRECASGGAYAQLHFAAPWVRFRVLVPISPCERRVSSVPPLFLSPAHFLTPVATCPFFALVSPSSAHCLYFLFPTTSLSTTVSASLNDNESITDAGAQALAAALDLTEPLTSLEFVSSLHCREVVPSTNKTLLVLSPLSSELSDVCRINCMRQRLRRNDPELTEL